MGPSASNGLKLTRTVQLNTLFTQSLHDFVLVFLISESSQKGYQYQSNYPFEHLLVRALNMFVAYYAHM